MSDERALAWTHLLPPEASLIIPNGPDWLPRTLASKSDESAVKVLVLHDWSATAHYDLSHYQGIALVSEKPISRFTPESLGFHFTRQFAVFPGWHDARFLVPLDNNRIAAGALSMERPFRQMSRLKHHALRLMFRTGYSNVCRGFLILALRHQSPLETLLSKVCGGHFHRLALCAGRAGDLRKVNAVALTLSGQPIAYLKLASNRHSREALNREAKALSDLATTTLSNTVPKLLAFQEDSRHATLVVEAGPDRVAPTHLTKAHFQWLSNLADYSRSSKPFAQSLVAHAMEEDWADIKDRVHPTWMKRIDHALARIHRELGNATIPLTMAHGDFAPWNIRQISDTLIYVFDWEMYKHECTPMFDAFHFRFITSTLLGRGILPNEVTRWFTQLTPHLPTGASPSYMPAFFCAYLVITALTYLKAVVARGESKDDLVLSAVAPMLDTVDYWWAS